MTEQEGTYTVEVGGQVFTEAQWDAVQVWHKGTSSEAANPTPYDATDADEAAFLGIDAPDVDPHQWPAEAGSILTEAHAAIYGDRQTDYGTPRENWTRTAILWTGLLQHKLAEGEYITPEDGLRCMVAVKLARDVNAPKRDNRVDGAGYLALLDRLETGQ